MRSRARLNADLLRALRSSAITVRAAAIPDATASIRLRRDGRGQLKGGAISIDVHQDGAITAVIHELLHFHLYDELLAWGNLEETIVLALERDLYQWVQADNRRLERWRAAIQRKLV